MRMYIYIYISSVGGHLDLDDLSCAMIAVFGVKFKKQDE